MDLLIQGKRALVVGGSAGIGRSIVEGLAREGAQVAAVARGAEALDEVVRAVSASTGEKVLAFAGDVADADTNTRIVDQAAEQLGGLDIVVNCISAPIFGPFMEHTDDDWESAMRIKFHSYVRTIRNAVPYLRKDDGGVVVNVIGKGGKTYLKDHLAGGASNAALMLLTVGLATELGPERIRVVGVNPGATRTQRFDGLLEHLAHASSSDVEAVEREFTARIPTGTVPLAQDVADLAVFLASGRARQVNGTVVTVDGGSSAAL